MKNDMNLIMENWRRETLLEGVVDLIKNKKLDGDAIEEIGDKLSKKEGFNLAVQFFSSLGEMDPDEMEELDEGALEWIDSKIVQGLIAKDKLVDTLKTDPRFSPILKLGAPALAMAYLYYKHKTSGVDPSDLASAAELIVRKGKIDLESLAQGTNVLENATQ